MATNAAEFLIKLNQQVSGPATAAEGALQKLENAVRQEKSALAQLEAEFSKMTSGPLTAWTSKHTEMVAKIQASKEGIATLSSALPQMTANAQAARTAHDALGGSAGKMGEQSVNAGGAVGMLQSALSKLGPQGQAAALAIGLATIAITAFVGVIGGGMAMAIHMTETLAHMRAQFDALAGGAAAGGKVSAMVEGLAAKLPFATSQIADWTRKLMAVGVQGGKLQASVKAIAAASAVMGSEGATAAEGFFKRLAEGDNAANTLIKDLQKGGRRGANQLAEMGLRTADLAKAMGLTEAQFKKTKLSADQLRDAAVKALQAKGASELTRQMFSWDNILGKAKEGFMSIFGGLKGPAEGFMASVGKLFSLFNKGGFAIQILKPIATSVFGTLFSWASKALDFAYQGFIRLAIWGVKAYIMAHPLVGAFKELWGAVVQLGTALGIVGGKSSSLGILAFIGKVIALNFQGIVAVIKGVVGAITWVVTTAAKVIAAIKGAFGGLGAAGKGAGGNLVTGLVQGILGAAGAAVGAIGSLASSMLGAFRGAFNMHSPSVLLRHEGRENIGGAVAMGVDESRPRVQRAMANLKGGLGGGRSAGAAAGGGDVYNFDFSGAHIGAGVDFGEFKRMLVRAIQEARRAVPEMEPEPA